MSGGREVNRRCLSIMSAACAGDGKMKQRRVQIPSRDGSGAGKPLQRHVPRICLDDWIRLRHPERTSHRSICCPSEFKAQHRSSLLVPGLRFQELRLRLGANPQPPQAWSLNSCSRTAAHGRLLAGSASCAASLRWNSCRSSADTSSATAFVSSAMLSQISATSSRRSETASER